MYTQHTPHHLHHLAPTLRAAMLLPVRLDQLGEEGCQVLVLVLVLVRKHAHWTGRAVQVHDLPGSKTLKFHIVKHDGASAKSAWRC